MAPKALYLLLIACIFGTIIQMSFANSSESPESSDSSSSSESSDSTASPESEEKPVTPTQNKDTEKPQKPLTKAEEAENKTVVKRLEIVLPKIPAISPVPGLKPNVDKAKDLVAHRLNKGGNFVNAVANSLRAAVHAVKPVIAIAKLISNIIQAFAEIASLNPVRLGILVLQEGVKIGMGVLSASIPILITGAILAAN